MGLKDKFKDFISPIEEDEEYVEFDEHEAKNLSEYERSGSQSMSQVKADTRMVLFEPRTFEESEEVARHLKERRAAVVNLHRLPATFQQRTIDFLTGVVFAIDGTIQKIGQNVILCSPKTIGVSGEISFDLNDDQ
ncbi:MAG: cell division protein SepF [Erysipelothrix sp.]|nr:cell division protein SepF [Erysipelothrix sp.]